MAYTVFNRPGVCEDNRLSILHLRASPFVGSPEKMLLGHLKHLDVEHCRYVITAFEEQRGRPNEFLEQARKRNGKTYSLHASIVWLPINLFTLIKVIRRENISVLCAHDYKSNLFGALIKLLLGIPVVSVFHGRTSHDRKVRIYEKLDSLILPYFDNIIVVSNYTKSVLNGEIDEQKIRVIPNAVENELVPTVGLPAVRQDVGAAQSERLVVFAGRLSREKGVDVLLGAVGMVARSVPNVRFLILGQGPEETQLKRLSRRLGIDDHVSFIGYRGDIERFLGEMDLLVVPSFREGLPLVILEAFLHKKPVVATRVGGIPEVVEDGVSGSLVDSGNSNALAGAIVRILTNPVLAKDMGLAGYGLVSARHNMKRHTSQYANVFQEVSRTGHARGQLGAARGGWIWLSWEQHRRTRELSKELNINLLEKNVSLPRLIKHPFLLLWTCYALLSRRPKGVIVQSPSVLLALFASFLKRLLAYSLVVDAHNDGVRPFCKTMSLLGSLLRYIHKNADLTIVSNSVLAEDVRRNGGIPFVLPDKLPSFPKVQRMTLSAKWNLTCICTFARDEPVGEVIRAASGIGSDCAIYVTGESGKHTRHPVGAIPPNIVLTGYLPDEEYLRLLKSCDIIIDLTDMPDCLVCGAYEAVAVEKPIILSDSAVLKEYFYKGAVFTKNEADCIRSAIRTTIDNYPRLQEEIISLKQELNERWAIRRDSLIQTIRVSGGKLR